MATVRSIITTSLRNAATINRAQRGLYAGKKVLFGVKSAEDKKSPIKSLKIWKPNVFEKRYYSDILKRYTKVKVTTKAIRCIDKAGGFDNYILMTQPEKLDSELGMKLRVEMLQKMARRAEHDMRREANAAARAARAAAQA
ncbi:uncharacterized protein MONBRDRAFT_34085 [Monosiga brevicollis MX1]|uniref:Large ribosomal subunit protein bL28m n=1 Tax=Monosiga brevicollis TaxID=81824 RepID=A9V9D4_MONBE|nr:uncharacterized protein MONBRDRAFT_34085 [Monosiga brevicollis MX1]EDQ85910.1 predicted protein [Monosiga brevicollis MX1]|eukprot:XP_001749389.1 hypothetical protein [Monosiga brevicollis MX1]